MKRSLVLALLLGIFASFVLAQECQPTDYEGQYTQCRPDNTHDLVYYLKRNITCSGGAQPLPPKFDLPCNITCGQGEYLPLGELVCSPCDPGTFTRGGGLAVSEWNSWPTNLGVFSTYCVNNVLPNSPPINCSGWVLNGGNIRSGVIEDVQSSILILQTQLVIPGVMRFAYRVDAEPRWDYLMFSIDGVSLLQVSVTSTYVEFAANVSAGYHTLKWEYYKDRSLSRGFDAAFISSIEITGLTYEDSSCTLCSPGTYTRDSASIQCNLCPLNTFTTDHGATSCAPCPDGQFSYMGASECSPKVPCTEADYQILYGPCSAENTRTRTAAWLEPHICDASEFSLPTLEPVPCSACPPGTAKQGGPVCTACPTGTFSAGNGAPCQLCGVGRQAPKSFNFSAFDSWPEGVRTSCSGSCGTNGWRLRSDYIDSGAGHGSTVQSSVTIPITLEQPGFVTFSFQLNCSRFCTLYYLDYPYDASIEWNTTSVKNNTLFTYTTPEALEVGPHNLTWIFELQPFADLNTSSRFESARIFSIIVNGSTIGGASTCTSCKNGTVAAEGSSFCAACSAGSTSNPTLSQCTSCTGNTFSPDEGSVCYECGPTTTVNSNHTDCTDTCKFVLNGDMYDLTALGKTPFGPVKAGEYAYYINLCGRGNFVDECHDIDDIPLNTHVCQVLPYDYSLDVGWSSGYYPIPQTVGQKGFRVHYDLGVMGCGPKNNGVAYPRSTDLTFICDPQAGEGTLKGVNSVENMPCNYQFEWRSLYACPICTEKDYSFYYTLCGSNGKRNKIYYWKDPVLCHGGAKLPAQESVTCSDSTVVCGVGEQISVDGLSCIPCPAGEYSVGGGLLIRSWPPHTQSLPYEYTTTCDGSCTPWVSDYGVSIHSGFGDSSLYGTHSFRTDGSISFDYKVFAHADGVFTFYVDGEAKLTEQLVSIYQWTSWNVTIPAGTHFFRWRFQNGIRYSPSLLTYQGVSIYNILVSGIDFHADTCIPCPDGSYATNASTSIGCTPCPANTYDNAQTAACVPCPANQFSLPGSTHCLNKTVCTAESYVPQYTPCVGGKRNVHYVKVQPDTCTGGALPPLDRNGIACAACPPFTISSGNGTECTPCPPGQYYRNGECETSVSGYIVKHAQYYFYDDSTTTWPELWSTGCSGACGTDGWRIAGASINSGFHASNAIDSYVGVIANFVFQGQVNFTYTLNTEVPLDGFQFAIDGVVVPIPVPQDESASPVFVSVPVSSGVHNLVWNYHQEAGTGFASLSHIVLSGVIDGMSSLEPLPCEPGQFSADPNATSCDLCRSGTFASHAGSNNCEMCPNNTYNPSEGATECRVCDLGSSAPAAGSIQCTTSCVFTIGSAVYDLNGLAQAQVFDESRRKYMINVCNNVAECPNSHSCILELNNTITEAGNSFRLIPDDANSTAAPFGIAFEHGDLCPGTDIERSTVIQFECEMSTPSPTPDYEGTEENCVTMLSWRTSLACRKCDDSDYTTITGGCSGGRRQMTKTRISTCNGPPFIPLKEEKCSGQEFPLGAILAVVFVFIAVVAIAIFIFFRNRKLAVQYSTLLEETRTSQTL